MEKNLFEIFLRQWSLPAIQQAFYQLCINRGVDPTDHLNVYEKLKQADRFCDSSFKQKQLWNLLDKRRNEKVYQNQGVCRGMNVLVVGAGPCGLRMAIEGALLGANVVVVDGRDKFTRNNVVHLWKFVIEDLKGLGAKIFFPKFCTGSIEHISIRKLQFVLLKVALILGVQFYDKVDYKDLKEPQDGKGWRAVFEPSDHILSDYEFDVIVGATGKQKTLPAFKHNPVRGKLAIGVTANFVRHNSKQEDSVPEIQGVAYVYRQDYFDELERKTKVQLENIVYYKGDTHYFVMCGKKQNLIAKGVIKQDKEDIKALLAKDNVDMDMLCKYVTQVVDFCTESQLGQLEFALNARKKPDIACFDFTTLESADHSTRFVKYMGHPLILSLVGDYLHEPFWPTGTGIARGFLGVLDTAWLLRNVGLGKQPMSQILAEREYIYSLLSTTQPTNLSNSYHAYTIDPSKRYSQFRPILPNVEHLMGSDNDEEDLNTAIMQIVRQSKSNAELTSLFRFCFMAALSKKVRISSFKRTSWADGSALASIISKYNLDFEPTVPITSSCNPATLCAESFEYAEQQLGIPQPCKTQYEWATMKETARIDYLKQLVDHLRSNPFCAKLCLSPTLLSNFNNDRAIQSALQQKILRPRQYLQNNTTINPVFNFDALEERVTKRQKLEIPLTNLESALIVSHARRSSIEPLNPELVYKIDKISSKASSKTIAKQVEEKKTVVVVESKHEIDKEEIKIESMGVEQKKSTTLDETLEHGSLAGLKSVSQYRKQFDKNSNRQRTSSTKSNSISSHASSLPATSSDSSAEEEQHPADPMHHRQVKIGSLPSNGVSNDRLQPIHRAVKPISNGPSNVVYRSTTQHQFINSRRPISTPSMLTSPELCKTFGHRKPQQEAVTAAQQQVYRTVSQRRMKLCALCNNEVYLAEQKIVDDRLCVHKQCFRCSYCNRILEVGKAHIDRSFVSNKFGVRWYCQQHHTKSLQDKLQQLMKTASKQKSSTAVAIVSPTKLVNNQRQNELPPAKPSYPQRAYIASSSTESSTNSLNEVGNTQVNYDLADTLPPRPPTPPSKNNARLSSSKYRKRLSDLNSPTQLIEACKQRTHKRLESLGLKEASIDENLELKMPNEEEKNEEMKWQNEQSSSDQENDRQSSESFEGCDQYEETVADEEEEEFLDADEDFSNDETEQIENDAWDELKSYLESHLTDSQILAQLDKSATTQAREIVETFNKLSILNHFKNPQTPAQQKSSTLDSKTPYFTPREGRSETVPDVDTTLSQDAFFTPRSTLRAPAIIRRSSTLDRKPKMPDEIDKLKQQIQQKAGQFENPTNGIDSQTPKRRQRIPRGPRRATVAVDLKRESLAPDDAVASTNLKEQQKSEQNGQDTSKPVKIRRSPSVQQRQRALHIRPTDENLERVILEIEFMKNRRNNEKERQLQALQRRLDEIFVRKSQVINVGGYLEKLLRKDPRNKWDLEQWLSYSQQFEELKNEEEQLKLKLKICHLEDQYQNLKIQLHAKQEETLTADNQLDSEKGEKEIMEKLLELLNEKDANKALLHELEADQRPKTAPSDLVKRAPSYTCFSSVFINDEPKPTNPIQYNNDRIPV